MKRLIITTMLLFVTKVSTPSEVIHTLPNLASKYETTNLVDLFTRKTSLWAENGLPITVYIRDFDTLEHKLFVIETLRLTWYRYRQLLEAATYSGRVSNVQIANSEEEMVTKVGSNLNSIGYSYLNKEFLINIDGTLKVLRLGL
jgi:ABC-type phosphate transport system substrate-binding protein